MLSNLWKKAKDQLRRDVAYTPYDWVWNTGIIASRRNGVWVYKVLPTTPLVYASEETREVVATKLRYLFTAAGSISRTTRLKSLAQRREFHILSVKHLDRPYLDEDSENLSRYLNETIYPDPQNRKTVFVGFKLRSSPFLVTGSKPPSGGGMTTTIYELVRGLSERVSLDSPASLKDFEKDLEILETAMGEQGLRNPTSRELSVLLAWHESQDSGDGGMARIVEHSKFLEVENTLGENLFWELKGVTEWRDELPEEPWMAIANAGGDDAWVVSMRGELEKSGATRNRIQREMRKMQDNMEQSDKTGSLLGIEEEAKAQEMVDLEAYYAMNKDELTVPNFSVTTAKRLFPDPYNPDAWDEPGESYSKRMEERYSIHTAPLVYMQMGCARETIPCAPRKIGTRRPFKHHVTLDLVTKSGISGCSQLGDKKGAHLGYSVPDGSEVRLDFGAASSGDRPPLMAIVGEPGGGKTVVSQSLVHQASLDSKAAMFVNPKGNDSLKYMLEATGGELITLGSDSAPGSLDPFRFAKGEVAVNIAMGFLSTVFPTMEERALISIDEGLRKKSNPECMMEAVGNISSRRIKDMLEQMRRSNPIIGLCMGEQGGEFQLGEHSLKEKREGVMLVEFGGDIRLPAGPQEIDKMGRAERFGVAAVSLLMQAMMNIIVEARRGQLLGGQGSFLVLDEAWIMLSSQYLVDAYLQALLRLGRSLDVTVVLSTQRVTDITRAELSGYISRALMMRLTDPKEQNAALDILGLDPSNKTFRNVLAESGATRREHMSTGEEIREAPIVWHKDLAGNVGVIETSLPPSVLDIYSTNPDDRRDFLKRLARLKDEME